MTATPDHTVIGFIAKHSDVTPANQVGDPFEILRMGYSTGWVVRAVKKNSFGARIIHEEALDIVKIRSECPSLLERRQAHAPATARYVGTIGRKLGTKDKDPVARIHKGLTEQLLKRLRARPCHDVGGRGL